MNNVVVLISGRGSNLRALLEAARAGEWERRLGIRVAAVISNRPDAPGIGVAAAFGVPVEVIAHRDFASREAFDAALAQAIECHAPALVVLAGFMRVLTPAFVERFAGRLINVHPSLLPSFPGTATHRQALAAGVRVHGATVHFVSNEVDAGAIIAQGAIAVRCDDDERRLEERVLAVEHQLLARSVALVASGKVWLEHGHARVSTDAAESLSLFPPCHG